MDSMVVSPRKPRIATLRPATAAKAAGRCVAWIRYRMRIRRDTEALMALDDHLLADMGLDRPEIGRALRRAYRGGGR
ncbi:DUF1127 domain-containing protein [Inquilinus limosus]|uniref:DUF1127 domain-containing protein n=1 Tax=Inquilinus limosus TaxID=171674 RepID=UPI0003F8E320|nr:DUF1127 domain-containing protein [Inquilinus limosus]